MKWFIHAARFNSWKVALCNFSVFLKNLDDVLLLWCWYIGEDAGNKEFDVGNSVAEVRTKSCVGDRKVALCNF
jgi:hypothetical protein